MNIEQYPDILTLPEAAQILRMSRTALQKLLASGEVNYIEIAG